MFGTICCGMLVRAAACGLMIRVMSAASAEARTVQFKGNIASFFN